MTGPRAIGGVGAARPSAAIGQKSPRFGTASGGTVSPAVREYLAVLDDAVFGGATPVEPKQLAVATPASRWTAAKRERAFFAFSTNYLIELDHAAIYSA